MAGVLDRLTKAVDDYKAGTPGESWTSILRELDEGTLRQVASAMGTRVEGTGHQVAHDIASSLNRRLMTEDVEPKVSAGVKTVPSDTYSLFTSAGEVGQTAEIPDSLARAIGGRDRASLIRAAKKLNKDFGFKIKTAGATKAGLAGEVLSAIRGASTTDAVSLGGDPATSGRGSYSAVRQMRAAGRTSSLPDGGGSGGSLARRGGSDLGLARSESALARVAGAGPEDIIDAEFTMRRGGSAVPGGPSGPFYQGPASQRALPGVLGEAEGAGEVAAVGAGAAAKTGLAGWLEYAGLGSKTAGLAGKALGIGGKALGVLAVLDLLGQADDATSGRVDRQRMLNTALAQGQVQRSVMGLQEAQESERGRVLGGLQGAVREQGAEDQVNQTISERTAVENEIDRNKNELIGMRVMQEPDPMEYALAVRRFM